MQVRDLYYSKFCVNYYNLCTKTKISTSCLNKSNSSYIFSYCISLLCSKVEAPVTNNLRVISNVQRLFIQMDIFLLCKEGKYSECYFSSHGIEFSIKFQGKKFSRKKVFCDMLPIANSNVHRRYILPFKI